MAKAVWNGVVLAESDHTEIVEGNHYFPGSTIKKEYFKESDYHTVCPWKGNASYYTIEAGGQVNENAAWYYPAPKKEAEHITGHVAFWKGVDIQE